MRLINVLKRKTLLFSLILPALLSVSKTTLVQAGCDTDGVVLQVLGSGGPEIMQDQRASSSYLLWLDGKARLLVDAGAGQGFVTSACGFPPFLYTTVRYRRWLHMPPSVIGRIAANARVKQLVLSHRMQRTLGHETQTRHTIQKSYQGSVEFANDLDCFRPLDVNGPSAG